MKHGVNQYAAHLMDKQLFALPKYKNMSLKDAVAVVKDSPTRVVCVAGHPDAMNIVRHTFENKQSAYSEYVPSPNVNRQDMTVLQGKTSVRVLYAQPLPNVGRHHPDYIPLTLQLQYSDTDSGGL